ncbi:hypothetical protein GJ496_011314 [Pomphorhynchus laevis]|nr:hypothetical protein GJ496_011314 [Pomphorhynchus laevis]
MLNSNDADFQFQNDYNSLLDVKFNRILYILKNNKALSSTRITRLKQLAYKILEEMKRSCIKPPQNVILYYSKRLDILNDIRSTDDKFAKNLNDSDDTEENECKQNLRNRKPRKLSNNSNSQDKSEIAKAYVYIDESCAYHLYVQNQMSEDMLQLTRILKHNAKEGSRIIQRDISRIDVMDTTMDKNTSEIGKLSYSVRICLSKISCWRTFITWMLLIFSFLFIVIIISLFPK